MSQWTTSDIPSQNGRTAVVTGTGGLGFEDALALARAGANVIVSGRNASKGLAAVNEIRQRVPGASVGFEELDLANLESIEAFAARLRRSLARIDLLINNAGVMAPPRRQVTANGFELQFGINYLGHFALTAQLLPLLCKGEQARVVTVSSVAALQGAIHFNDLQSERGYKAMVAYGQSKLACLMFALELQRRSDAGGWGLRSIASHPGVSRTELLLNGAGRWSAAGLARRLLWFVFQPVARGALPTLFAASAPQAQGGVYYGPDGIGELRGDPAVAKIPAAALDTQVASKLWSVSERLTGAVFSTRSEQAVNVASIRHNRSAAML